MILNAVEATSGRLPIMSEDWHRLAPDLCEGLDADYLLVDLGPEKGDRRYTLLGLRADDRALYSLGRLADIQASLASGGLGIAASLFVPLYRTEEGHRGHVAALYLAERRFAEADVTRLQRIAGRFLSLLRDS